MKKYVTLKELWKYGWICGIHTEDGDDLDSVDPTDDLTTIRNLGGMHIVGKDKRYIIEVTPVLEQVDEHIAVARLKFRCHKMAGECE